MIVEMPPGGEAIADRIMLLGHGLRARGVDVTVSEIIDAAQAATVVNLGSRAELRVALRAAMVKSDRHLGSFDAVFDRLFPLSAVVAQPSDGSEPTPDLADLVAFGGDTTGMAAQLVEEHGGLDGPTRGERHHLQRALRAADLARLMSDARQANPELSTADLRERIEELKRLMAAEVRYRLGAPDDPATDAAADLDFLNATRAQLADMRDAVRPLARKLATRLARRRQARRGRSVSFRRTMRKSLGTGGVPFEVVYDRPRAQRPELFVLCDISGSVANFSVFTLTLMSALSAEIARCRSFVFVDAIDEVTSLLAATGHGLEPWQIMRNTNVIADDGHSDYGAVLTRFWDGVGAHDLGPKSTVLITGDARTNYRPACSTVLEAMSRRCRGVYWLNPEPRAEWDTYDSQMAQYSPHCKGAYEVRTVSHLVNCVEQLL